MIYNGSPFFWVEPEAGPKPKPRRLSTEPVWTEPFWIEPVWTESGA